MAANVPCLVCYERVKVVTQTYFKWPTSDRVVTICAQELIHQRTGLGRGDKS